ncbi:MAG TPA: family 16 glycosylhydrolase [Marinagarivorans sp.]
MSRIIKYLKVTAFSVLAAGALNAAAKPYKGAEIFTTDEGLYGKFVIRMQAAKASGVISNFFLWKDGSELDGVPWEEVDIEVFGKNNANSWQSNIISGLDTKQYSEQVHTINSSFADAYHTFAMEWTPDQVRWLVDGEVIRTTNGGQARDLISPAQARINFWPPENPAWVGDWNDSVLPLYMFVNWVEFYSWNGSGFDLKWRDDFDSFNTSRWGTADWTFAENRADFSPANVVVKNGYLVLALTREGQEGFTGNPPVDQPAPSSSSQSSSIASSSSSSTVSSSASSESSSSPPSSSATVSSVASSAAQSSSSSSQPSTITGGAFGFTAWGFAGLLLLFVGKLCAVRLPATRST